MTPEWRHRCQCPEGEAKKAQAVGGCYAVHSSEDQRDHIFPIMEKDSMITDEPTLLVVLGVDCGRDLHVHA